MKPPGGDWAVFIVFSAATLLAVAGAAFIGGYALTHAGQPTPSPTPILPQCRFGDFPYYQGSWAVAASTNGAEAWHVYAAPSQVANYFANGASNLAWHFRLISQTSTQWNFRMQRAPACSGSLTVYADPAGGTLYQATPDSKS